VVPARPEEHAQVLSILERFEGAATARLAEAWLAEQPDTLSVVRDREGVAAYAYHVMHPTGSAMEERDPVTRAAWSTSRGTARPVRASRSTSPASSPAGASSSATSTPCSPGVSRR
jgi:hypothetical protein